MKTFFKYKIEIIVFTLSVVVGFILFKFGNMRFPNDDQFILYLYVDNIISGNGFVFNVGEKILGSTTPLFTIVSSFFALLFKSVYIPNVIAYLNIVFLGLTSVYLFKIAKFFEIDNRFSYILIAIFSFNTPKIIP